jgi:hypothetical protein
MVLKDIDKGEQARLGHPRQRCVIDILQPEARTQLTCTLEIVKHSTRLLRTPASWAWRMSWRCGLGTGCLFVSSHAVFLLPSLDLWSWFNDASIDSL